MVNISLLARLAVIGVTLGLSQHVSTSAFESVCSDVEFLKLDVVREACSSYGSELKKRTLAGLDLSLDVHVKANVYIGFMDSCVGSSKTLLKLFTSGRASDVQLLTHLTVPTLVRLNDNLRSSINKIKHFTPCTDATVATNVHASFEIFASTHIEVLKGLIANAALWTKLKLKVKLHSLLIELQAHIEIYLRLLFAYVKPTAKALQLKLQLQANLGTAIKGCL